MQYFITILLLSFVILFHELGHFIFASWVNIPIKIFSIGFGPKLFSFMYKGTEYRISLIPLGGYVLPEVEDEDGFFQIPLYKRSLMSFGGPLASFILPVFCFAGMNFLRYGFNFWAVCIKALHQTVFIFTDMLAALSTLFTPKAQLSGVVGIVANSGHFIGSSLYNGLQFMALLSMNLAILNMIPIPALDGGKLFLYMFEWINPKFKKLHYPLALAGWILMIGLMVYATYMDIIHLVSKSAV